MLTNPDEDELTALSLIEDESEFREELDDYEQNFIVLDRAELEGSLYRYVQEAWHLVEPSQPFVPNWHVMVLCFELEEVYHGRTKRIIINIPPGTMKSLLIEVFFPTWVWARNSKKRFLTASYGSHLTMRDNLRARQIIESPWYQDRWQVRLQDDQNTKTRYNTTEHGWRIATSVNGQGIGEHPDFIIIDDPHTNAQAQSEVERQQALTWFDGTISTRLGRNPAIIVVMQRLHMMDLSGHLLARGGWKWIHWPMRYMVTRPATDDDPGYAADPRDPRTEEGELLCPSLFPEDKVKQLELDLGPYGTAGQLAQLPAPEGGGLFQRSWFKFADKAPALMRIARGWDTAASEGKGDWTVGVKIGEEFVWEVENGKKRCISTGRFFILDVQREQFGPAGVDELFLSIANLDGKDVAQREEKEGGASGKTVIAARLKLLKGFNYAGVQLGGSKIVRAKPFRSQCEGGNVFLVRGSWNEEFIRELTQFPTGTHDDQVDAASCAFNSVLLEEPPRKVSISWGKN